MSFSASAPRIEPKDLAVELESLSQQQVKEANRDLYGSSSEEEIKETADFCADALRRLEDALSQIEGKEEFDAATERCADYANSEEFRLMFLRAEIFDAEVSMIGYQISLLSSREW